MDRETQIKVIMADRSDRKNAEWLLDKGAEVYENPEEWIENLKNCDAYDGETIEKVRAGEYPDTRLATYENHEYLIAYCL